MKNVPEFSFLSLRSTTRPYHHIYAQPRFTINHNHSPLHYFVEYCFFCPRCLSPTGTPPIHRPSPPSQPVFTNAIPWSTPCIAKGNLPLHRTTHQRRSTTNSGPDSNVSTRKLARANMTIRLSHPRSWTSVTPPTRWGMVVYG